MKHLEVEDRSVISPYDPMQVDREFIPFLERINVKPFVASMECCIGHCPYDYATYKKLFHKDGSRKKRSHKEYSRKDCWGYIQLLMTCPSAMWLCQEVVKSGWLRIDHSKMWPYWSPVKPGAMPWHTELGNFVITLVWDSSAWPTPAEDICNLLDQYYAAEPDEPEHLLKIPASREYKLDDEEFDD